MAAAYNMFIFVRKEVYLSVGIITTFCKTFTFLTFLTILTFYNKVYHELLNFFDYQYPVTYHLHCLHDHK